MEFISEIGTFTPVRFLSLFLLCTWVAAAKPADDFIAAAQTKFGDEGVRAARFLVDNMPPADREKLSAAFLIENLELAFKARAEFSWARQVPEEIFFNDVLPYAVFDEPRDPWRADFYARSREWVKEAHSATEAAQILNRELFKQVNVHYNTGRKRPNQSPAESMALGKATCTGLSVILVDACRSVGIPARAVGTFVWMNERGNHTWTEVWDGDWHFTGADEYDAAGLDRGWFVGDASQAKADDRRHAIFATSWKRDGTYFPMVWAKDSDSVAAVNVTARYAKAVPVSIAAASAPTTHLGVRLLEKPHGERRVASLQAIDPTGKVLAEGETKAGRADLNDMPRLELAPGTRGWLRFTVAHETRELPFGPLVSGESTLDAAWSEMTVPSPNILALEAWLHKTSLMCTVKFVPEQSSFPIPALQNPLTRSEAYRALEILSFHRLQLIRSARQAEFESQAIDWQGKTLHWMARTYGEAPKGGHSLWISMHGGGNAPAAVNSQQWTNQIGLYKPEEGIYVAPRAPTDTWNLWHESHIDPMFNRLIEDYVAFAGVNPDKVYLMGYSAGGDGVWQLAPRMADQLAAASMMAGHPNDASLLGLRNLPFAIFMGGDDAAYNRNKIAAERGAELDRLAQADPGGYLHQVHIYPGLGHWMNRKDADAVPWMAGFQRQNWPKKVVWKQSDVPHSRFYWLETSPTAELKPNQQMVATVDKQTVQITGDIPTDLHLRLSDELVDLDQPIQVNVNGEKRFEGTVHRDAWSILSSLEDRADAPAAATATVVLKQ